MQAAVENGFKHRCADVPEEARWVEQVRKHRTREACRSCERDLREERSTRRIHAGMRRREIGLSLRNIRTPRQEFGGQTRCNERRIDAVQVLGLHIKAFGRERFEYSEGVARFALLLLEIGKQRLLS